jgi:hypothetical protein
MVNNWRKLMQKIKDFKAGKTIWFVSSKFIEIEKVIINRIKKDETCLSKTPFTECFYYKILQNGMYETSKQLEDYNAKGVENNYNHHKVFFTPQAAYKYFNKLEKLEKDNV